MRRLRFAALAKAHILAIQSYTLDTFGELQSDAYLRRIEEGLALIQRFPEIGATADVVMSGLRRLQIEEHNVFYTVDDKIIVVVHAILHRSQLPRRHLKM